MLKFLSIFNYVTLTTFAAAVETAVGHQKPKTHKKIVRTMVAVVACFIICWFPLSVGVINAYFNEQAVTFLAVNSSLLTMIAYMNMVANPIIYGAHFNALRRCTRDLCGCFAETVTGETSFSGHTAGSQRRTGYSVHVARIKTV